MQNIRSNPNYPMIIVYGIAAYMAIVALLGAFEAYSLFTVKPNTIVNGQIITQSNVSVFKFWGGVTAFFSFLFAWCAIGLFLKRRKIRRQAILLNAFWAILTLIGIGGGVSTVQVVMVLVFSILAVVLLAFDKRIKDYLGATSGNEATPVSSTTAL